MRAKHLPRERVAELRRYELDRGRWYADRRRPTGQLIRGSTGYDDPPKPPVKQGGGGRGSGAMKALGDRFERVLKLLEARAEAKRTP